MTTDSAFELGQQIGRLMADQQTTNQNISPDEAENQFSLGPSEFVLPTVTYVRTKSTYPTDSFILDHLVYGYVDSAVYKIDGGYLAGSSGIWQYVYNENDTFYEFLITQAFVDTTLTTAAVDVSARTITYSATQNFVSNSISLNDGNVNSATLSVTPGCMNDSSKFTFYLSNNGGSNWFAVTSGVPYTFSTSGQDLRYKIVGTNGAVFSIKPGDGFSYPIYIVANIS